MALRYCALLLLFVGYTTTAAVVVNVGDHVLWTVSPTYCGVNIDAASLYQGTLPYRLDFTDDRLLKLARTLSAEYGAEERMVLRIGGSAADGLWWGPSIINSSIPFGGQRIQVDQKYWDHGIVSFVAAAGFVMVWDLNGMGLRTGSAKQDWDSRDAVALLQHVAANPEQAAVLAAVQLGNEPGHWQSDAPDNSPSATQHGKDFARLKSILAAIFAGNSSTNSGGGGGSSGGSMPKVQGPDVCFGKGIPVPIAKSGGDKCANYTYFDELLSTSDCAIDEVTVHSYGLINSKNLTETQCSVDFFLSPWVWEAAMTPKLAGWKAKQEAACPASKMVLGETATAGDGGCVGLSNTFAAGFFWVDTLGNLAQLGYWQVYRQDLIGWSGIGDSSSYALIGDPGAVGGSSEAAMLPNPDYFTTRLWIRLMGDTVLPTNFGASGASGGGGKDGKGSKGGDGGGGKGDDGGRDDDGVRVFAHCTTSYSAEGSTDINSTITRTRTYPTGSVTLAIINPTAAPVPIKTASLQMSPRVEYILTSSAARNSELPRDTRLQARTVQLNGAGIALQGADPMVGKHVESGVRGSAPSTLVMPPYSYGFVVLPAANHQGCIA